MNEPILVESLSAKQVRRLRCENCGYERDCNLPDELNQEDTYDCPACGAWSMHFKYVQADSCANCKKLGHWDRIGGRLVCSRVCLLQLEYGETLKARPA